MEHRRTSCKVNWFCYTKHMRKYELVALEPGEPEELVATGARAQMERDMDHLLADYLEGGEQEGQPVPEYRVQPAQ